MHGLVDRHGLVDPAIEGMVGRKLPSGVRFEERQSVWTVSRPCSSR
jgi:hypothetical protein